MADDIDNLMAKVITQAFVAGQMDAQLKHADEATRPALKLLQAKTYAMAQESIHALVAAVRAENVPSITICSRCGGHVPATPPCQCDTPLPAEAR